MNLFCYTFIIQTSIKPKGAAILKIYFPQDVPDHLLTKNKLKKMSLRPISEHVGFVVYPPQTRKYKLYSLEQARPIDPQAGFSLLYADTSPGAKQRFEELKKRILEKNFEEK
ncbi:hypothetical protein D3C73_1205460 [compost metagenome]